MTDARLPPGQQLTAPGKWPLVGEREPAPGPQVWKLEVTGCVERPASWSIDELLQFPQTCRRLDLHCVTRWTMLDAEFSGVLLQHVLDAVHPGRDARFLSFVARSPRRHSTSLPLTEALELETLLATGYQDQPLPTSHGGPLRSVVPRRYFYKSLKWLERIDILEQDRLGYWEGTAGYHNRADPWREERFIASSISRQDAGRILTERNIARRDLLGLDAADRELRGLDARHALLRNACFTRSQLDGAQFDGANLSHARFTGASLRGASFRGADLEGADFSGADLRAADLRGASLLGAAFGEPSDVGGPATARMDGTTRLDGEQLEMLLPAQAGLVRAIRPSR